MLDREAAENLLWRVASSAISYYPDKPTREPGYTISEDIDWCLEALPAEDWPHWQRMRARIGEVIADPTTHREAFRRDVMALVTR